MIPCIQFGGDTEVRSEPAPRDPETLDPFGPQNHPITEVERMDTITLFGGFDGAFEYFDTQQADSKIAQSADTHKLTLPMQDGEPVCGTFTNADGVSIIVERIEGVRS